MYKLRFGISIAVYIADQLGIATKVACGISRTAQQQNKIRLVRMSSLSNGNREILMFLNVIFFFKKNYSNILVLVPYAPLLAYNQAISEDGGDGSRSFVAKKMLIIISMFVSPLLKKSLLSQGALSNGKAERKFQLQQHPSACPYVTHRYKNNHCSWSLRRFVHP